MRFNFHILAHSELEIFIKISIARFEKHKNVKICRPWTIGYTVYFGPRRKVANTLKHRTNRFGPQDFGNNSSFSHPIKKLMFVAANVAFKLCNLPRPGQKSPDLTTMGLVPTE